MLKELLKLPFFVFFQPKELERRLNEKVRQKRFFIWLHLLILPILFCLDFLALYLASITYFYEELITFPILLSAFLVASFSYVFTIVASFFTSGLFKTDNVVSFIIGSYYSILINLLVLFSWLFNGIRMKSHYEVDNTLYIELGRLIAFVFFAFLLFSLCSLVTIIYGKVKQFWSVFFIICFISIIVNFLLYRNTSYRDINYFFVANTANNEEYIYFESLPHQNNDFLSFLPTTYVDARDNDILFNIETGEEIEVPSWKLKTLEESKNQVKNLDREKYGFKKIYSISENFAKDFEIDLINRLNTLDKIYSEQQVKNDINALRGINELNGSPINSELDLKESLVSFTNQINNKYFKEPENQLTSAYLLSRLTEFNKDLFLILPQGKYHLSKQLPQRFIDYKTSLEANSIRREYSFQNLKIFRQENEPNKAIKIIVENKLNDSKPSITIPGREIIALIPLKDNRIFLQTELGYYCIDNKSEIIWEGSENNYPYKSNVNLESITELNQLNKMYLDERGDSKKIYSGDKIYVLSPSGYLAEIQASDGQIKSIKSVYADLLNPLKNYSFYYVCFYYIFVTLLITFLGFYRLPIFIVESILHTVLTIALSLRLISPELSKILTPVFFEHISILSFPFAKRYLNTLFKLNSNLCTERLIYLLTETNQKKFLANFTINFLEEKPEFLFDFIYKSLKHNNGRAIFTVIENTNINNSITDLFLSYKQVIKSPKPYVNTHSIYLKHFVDENYRYANEILFTYKAFSLFYKYNDLHELADLDKSLKEVLKINYGELLNPQVIEMFSIIAEFSQDVKNYDIVENFRDKQYYLSEARIKLYDLSSQSRELLYEPERTIFLEISEKWQGVITSEAKSLRGPADIAISILNKNLSVNTNNEWQSIVIKIENMGLSPAENIKLTFLENENIQVREKQKDIQLLGIGEATKIEFSVKTIGKPTDLRINIDTSFDDFERKNKLRVFADILSVTSSYVEYQKVLNPYIVGTPLKNEKIFVGRSSALRFALSNLSSGTQNNILIYFGQRRIGKSSILYQLMSSSLNFEYIFVYIDCQGFADSDTARLLYRLCREIRNCLLKRQISIEEPSLDKFKENTFLELDDYLDKVEQSLAGKKVALMFDEYEFLEYKVKDGAVSPEIFNKLRNLMQHRNRNFAFIFVGTHRLTELTEDYWSFLFNIALYYEIGTLDEKDAKNLIVKPVEGYIKYDQLVIDKMLRITGNHPYFIQVLCRLLVNYCNNYSKGYVNLKDLNEVLDEAIEGSTAHVKYLFNDCSTKSEQEVLTFLSRTTDETKLSASPIEIFRLAIESGFTYDLITVQEILSGLKNKKLVRQGGELGDLLGFEYEFLRLWIVKHIKIQKGFINIT